MSTITLPNIRVSSDLTVSLKLKDDGVAIDWSTLSNVKVSIYSDAQRALAGRCSVSIDEDDPTLLVCTYAANKPQYVGVNRVVVCAKYMGETKTYDKPAFNFVRWTDDQAGQTITIDDPDIDVEISVEDISSSILQEAVDAAFTAADRANDAAAAAEHMVDIHTGPQGEDGKSAYQCAVDEGYIGTEEEWLASLKGTDGADGADGDPAGFGTVSASVGANTGTPSVTVTTSGPDTAKNITFAFDNLKGATGETGATPAFSIGTVTTGAAGSQAAATITGTAAAPVLNLTIPQGDQGNTGSSVDYAYELVNNLTTNDATKGLSAAQGVVLDGKVSQLEAEVSLYSGSYTQAQARVYNQPGLWSWLLIQPGTTIKKPIWHIGGGVFIDAVGAVVEFPVVTPATPTFSPDGGAVAEGATVTLSCSTPDADIYVSTDDGETYTKTSTVTINSATTVKAYSELEGIRSSVVSKSFTVYVDHNFKFTVKLDTDNAIVYVPVVAGKTYNMTVDWGDGSATQTYAQAGANKGLSHTYTGVTGDTFQITLRGSAIPFLTFYQATRFTLAQLYSIDNNTLETTTQLGDANSLDFSLKGCSNIVSVCANANASYPTAATFSFEGCSKLTAIPEGFLDNFASTITAFTLRSCTVLSLSATFMSALGAKLNSTNFYYTFNACQGSIPIPDNFFDNITAGTVTDVRQMTGGSATGVTGDAKKLYDVLVVKATSGITNTAACFSGSNLTNRNQVPSAWGGTA